MIKEVYVVNSVANGTATEFSDIDLLVITENKMVLRTRLLLTIITQLLKIRVHGKKIAGRFCLSFIVDTRNSTLLSVMYENDTLLRDMLSTSVLIYSNSEKSNRSLYIVNVINFIIPEFIVRWHSNKAINRALSGNFKNPSIVISDSIFKFHENDKRRNK